MYSDSHPILWFRRRLFRCAATTYTNPLAGAGMAEKTRALKWVLENGKCSMVMGGDTSTSKLLATFRFTIVVVRDKMELW